MNDHDDNNNAGPSRPSHSHTPMRRNSESHIHSSASSSRHHFTDTDRSSHNPDNDGTTNGHGRPSSTSSSTRSPRKPQIQSQRLRLDIATYPTQQLLRLIAGLMQHIATSNDALRPDHDPDHDLIEENGDGDGDEHENGSNSNSASTGNAERSGSTSASASAAGYDSNRARAGTTETQSEAETERTHSRSASRSHSRASHRSTSTTNHPSSSPTTALFDHYDPTEPDQSDIPLSQPCTPSLNSSEFPLFTASRSSLSHPSSLLAFHARHIPSISIEAYLLRILKYCPTTNEVFLGLLVYFDRMTRLGTPFGVGGENAGVAKGKGFAIDSFNVHRLVIAGVTVASKFFSDVFYTNSRYAKVGGLPSTELNSLELQFLLLNDFRLRISLDEMQRYGDRLLAYAAEEEEKERERVESLKKEQSMSTGTGYGGGIPTSEDAHMASAAQRQADSTVPASASAAPTRPSGETQPSRPSDATATVTVGPAVAVSQSPLSTEQPSQPALAPGHPSAPNSAPTSRQETPTQSAQPSQPSHSQSHPLPSAPASTTITADAPDRGLITSDITPVSRAREYEPRLGNGLPNGNGDASGGHSVTNGLRDWVRGEEVMGRMASPMRE